MQMVKHHILASSKDTMTVYITHGAREKSKASSGKFWRPDREVDTILTDLKWEEKHMSRSVATLSRSKRSVNNPNISTCSNKEQRRLINARLKRQETEKMRDRLVTLCRNGNFLTWDSIISDDIGWKEMIYDLSDRVISFRLNAIGMSLPSLSNLTRWGLRKRGNCALCGKLNVTAAHVLSGCTVSLYAPPGRYKWRHDNVLAFLAKDLFGIVSRANRSYRHAPAAPSQPFIASGSNHTPKNSQKTIFKKHPSDDWNVVIDLHNNPTIPPETKIDTLRRPDIVFFSIFLKVILWAELTCPSERNMTHARLKKERRYRALEHSLSKQEWTVYPLTFEVGALGFLSKSTHRFLSIICDNSSQRKYLRKNISVMSVRSSYYIWMSRYNTIFTPPNLIARSKLPQIVTTKRKHPPRQSFWNSNAVTHRPHTLPITSPTLPSSPIVKDSATFLSSLDESFDIDIDELNNLVEPLPITASSPKSHTPPSSPQNVVHELKLDDLIALEASAHDPPDIISDEEELALDEFHRWEEEPPPPSDLPHFPLDRDNALVDRFKTI